MPPQATISGLNALTAPSRMFLRFRTKSSALLLQHWWGGCKQQGPREQSASHLRVSRLMNACYAEGPFEWSSLRLRLRPVAFTKGRLSLIQVTLKLMHSLPICSPLNGGGI